MKLPTMLTRQSETTMITPANQGKMQLVPRSRKAAVPLFFHWWAHLTRTERIVSMSLVVGGLVAIVNSITWALAASYMTRQKAKAQLATGAVEATMLMEPERERVQAMR